MKSNHHIQRVFQYFLKGDGGDGIEPHSFTQFIFTIATFPYFLFVLVRKNEIGLIVVCAGILVYGAYSVFYDSNYIRHAKSPRMLCICWFILTIFPLISMSIFDKKSFIMLHFMFGVSLLVLVNSIKNKFIYTGD